MLWVYAANDSFFAPEIAARMHAAFVGAGGAAELVAVGPFGKDGHALFGARPAACASGVRCSSATSPSSSARPEELNQRWRRRAASSRLAVVRSMTPTISPSS